jgi:cytochrome c553
MICFSDDSRRGPLAKLLCTLIGIHWVAAILCVTAPAAAAPAADPPPSWAFPLNPPDHPGTAPSATKFEHVPGSKVTYSDAQLHDDFLTADWFPDEHPPMPTIVAVGRRPHVGPCAACHLATGSGGPAEAALTGLPAAYIVEQLREFREGRRRAAEPAMDSVHHMEMEAKVVDAADGEAAARYFSNLTFKSHFHVVEADSVPKTRVRMVSVYEKIPGAGSEPLGSRIVEVPDSARQWELGNPHTAFTAYVPSGSIRRGEMLVASGDGAQPCRTCHGTQLKGAGNVPPLAGRSPSYLVRQLYDIQHGSRSGPSVAPMVPEVAHMTPADRIAIAAYLGSLR